MITVAIVALVTQEPPANFTIGGAVIYLFVSMIGGVVVYTVKSIIDRRAISAVAEKDEASAADVVSKAAAALVNPLRLELETVRKELDALKIHTANMATEMHGLTIELTEARRENTELEHENARLKLAAQAHGSDGKK